MGLVASDLMTTKVVTLTPEMDLLQMDTVLYKRGVSGAPVLEAGRLVGVASQGDIVRALWEGHHEAREQAPTYYDSLYPIPLSAVEKMVNESTRIGERLTKLHVRDIMTADPLVVGPDATLEHVVDRMIEDQIHRLPVVDEDNGELLGLISTLDIVAAIRRYGLAVPD